MARSDEALPEYRNELTASGYWNTVLGSFGLPLADPPSKEVKIALDNGDVLSCWDAIPLAWKRGDPLVVLVHGMAGSHRSRYMVRLSRRLFASNIRSFRMNLRGCGTGKGLSKIPHNAGASDDIIHVLRHLQGEGRISIAAYSLGGNMLLKCLGERKDPVVDKVVRAVALCPGIDPLDAALHLERPGMELVHKSYMKSVVELATDKSIDLTGVRTIREFDRLYTAVKLGYPTEYAYYAAAKAGPHVPNIRVPTVILYAEDDPIVGYRALDALDCPSNVVRHKTAHGGHMGYLARSFAHLRWMDDFVMGILN